MHKDIPTRRTRLRSSVPGRDTILSQWYATGHRTLLLVLVILSLSIPQFSTKADQMNELAETQGIEKAQQAKVVLLPPNTLFRVRVNEAKLGSYGCTYKTRDISHVQKLIDALKRANISKVEHLEPADEPWVLEPRESVFLGLTDESGFLFYFEAKYTNRDLVHGYLSIPDSNRKIYITADPSVVDDLIRWSAGAEASFGDEAFGRRSCEYFRDTLEKLK